MAGERYLVIQSDLVVTNPSGNAHKQRVYLAYDLQAKSVEVLVQDGVLKGYTIDTLISEIVRARDHGTPMHELPIVH